MCPNSISRITFILCVCSMISMLTSSAQCYTISNRWSSPLALELSEIYGRVNPTLLRFVILVFDFMRMFVYVTIRCWLSRKFDPSGTRLIIFYECFPARILSPRFHDFLIRFIAWDLLFVKPKKCITIFCLFLGNFNDSFFINIINNSNVMNAIIVKIVRQRKED